MRINYYFHINLQKYMYNNNNDMNNEMNNLDKRG